MKLKKVLALVMVLEDFLRTDSFPCSALSHRP